MGEQNKYEQLSTEQPPPLVEPSQASDLNFFNSLNKYKPILYRGEGTPIFLYCQQSSNSLCCLVFVNVLFLFMVGGVVWKVLQAQQQPSALHEGIVVIVVDVGIIILTNFSYVLTILLNPGIRNLATITDEEYWQKGKVFCSMCNGYRTGNMKHCKWCQVCVEDLDHHCGYFGKCIAGCQRFAFYICLTAIFAAFIGLLLALSFVISLQ